MGNWEYTDILVKYYILIWKMIFSNGVPVEREVIAQRGQVGSKGYIDRARGGNKAEGGKWEIISFSSLIC